MNLTLIGEFIAKQRKEKSLTQAALAEKLGITDRAVSKWERGKGLPDASLMLELCEILGITVNELLNGEKIEMDDYKKKTEDLLVELAKSEEEKNKNLMLAMYTILIVSIAGLVATTLMIDQLTKPGLQQSLLMIAAVVIFVAPMFIALKFEVRAGYYECKKCHNKFVTSYMKVLMAPHMGTTRHLKCPECGEKTWCKKVLKK